LLLSAEFVAFLWNQTPGPQGPGVLFLGMNIGGCVKMHSQLLGVCFFAQIGYSAFI